MNPRFAWAVLAAAVVFVMGYFAGTNAIGAKSVTGPISSGPDVKIQGASPLLQGNKEDSNSRRDALRKESDIGVLAKEFESPEDYEKVAAQVKPGLSVFKATLPKYEALNGLRGGLANPEEVAAIVAEGPDKYSKRITDSHLAALRKVLGDAWQQEALESDVRRAYEEWTRAKWDLHQEYHRDRTSLLRHEKSAARFQSLIDRRREWTLGVGEMRVDLFRRMSKVIPWEFYRPKEQLIDRALQMDE